MALDPKIIAKLKKDLAEINKIYKQLNMKPLSIEIETAGVDDILLIKQYLREAKELTEDLNEGFGGMAESIKNMFENGNQVLQILQKKQPNHLLN